MKNRIEYREAALKDIPVIAYLADKIWRKHYISIISAEQIEYMLNKFYCAASLTEQMKNKQRFFLAYVDNGIAGYLSVTEKTTGEFFLHKFYIDDSLRSKGMGTLFFEFILEKFKPEYISLTVNRKNYTAINFYFKLGFIIDHVEDFDIGNGYLMEDYVMQWKKGNLNPGDK